MTVQAKESLDPAPGGEPHSRGLGGRFRRNARTTLRASVPLLPAAALLALWMVWISASGGYFRDTWYPSALGVAALLLVMMLAGVSVLPRTRSARVALLSFGTLVAFNYLSILWAGSPGDALDASNRLLLYLVVGWAFSLLPWTSGWLAGALGVWSVGVAAFCALGLVHATGASSLNSFFVEYRYATPLHYPNATAALAAMGLWPALILSARREVPIWLRAVLLAVATFLAEFALLPQSRGAALGLALTAPVALVFAADCLRLLTRIAVVGVGLAISAPRTVAVDDAINAGHHVGPVLIHATNAMLLTSVGALALGALLALTDRFWSVEAMKSGRQWRLGRRSRLALAVGAVAVVAAGGILAAPRVSHFAGTVLKKGRTDASTGSTRLLSTTPEERFDYVRVSWRLFTAHPLLGVGAGNFGRHYDQLRRFQKHSQYTHDVALRALSETGIIGVGLLVTVIASLALGLVRTRWKGGGLEGACAVAALALATYFLVHDSFDWLDEFPALACPALAFALAAMGLRSGGDVGTPSAPRSRLRGLPSRLSAIELGGRSSSSGRIGRIAAGMTVTAVFGAAFIALVFPYLSTRYVERAFATFRARPAGAYTDLRRAGDLNPLSVEPSTSQGTIALQLGDLRRARSAFQRALRKQDDWYPWLELALLDAHAGRFALAERELKVASRLDVDDPVLAQARTTIQRRKRLDPVRFNQLLLNGPQADFFAPEDIKK